MTSWFLEDLKRLSEERSAIDGLAANDEWLKSAEWGFQGADLVVKVEIEAHGHSYPVVMTYPPFFPQVPPYVKPADQKSRWSFHQYGAGGTLCLEWGPDNWTPNITGAQMLQSAYRLLESENPLGSKELQGEVESRHALSIGQSTRLAPFRILLTHETRAQLEGTKVGDKGSIKFCLNGLNRAFVYHVEEYKINGDRYECKEVPPSLLSNSLKEDWFFYRTNATSDRMSKLKTILELEALIFQTDQEKLRLITLMKKYKGIFIVDPNRELIPLNFSGKELLRLKVISESSTSDRTPTDLRPLRDHRVGIVGVGSVGSKLAVSLARMGIDQFYLVDEDILLPGNLDRHALDWRSVGMHKVNALQNQMQHIRASIKVEVSDVNLSGQESSRILIDVLKELGACDVIVDATASGDVFNLLAHVAKVSEKPMVWGEVFAGGIGGLIARSRPNHDPAPHVMRQLLYEVLKEGPDLPIVSAPYTLEQENGEVMTASDADVSVIASHMTRLVADSVLLREPSMFPYSMYLIGLDRAWVFDEPFVTIPIKTDGILSSDRSQFEELNPKVAEENIQFISDLRKSGSS